MIYSPPGGRDAPFQSESCIGPPPSPPAKHARSPRQRRGLLAASRLPDNRTDTGVWQASFQRNYCRIKSANWEEKWVSAACHCHQLSLTNKPETKKCQLALHKPATFQLKKKNPKKISKQCCSHSEPTSSHSDLLITGHGGVVEDHFLNCRGSGSRYSYHGKRNECWEAARIYGFALTSALYSAAKKVLLDSTFASPTGFIPKYPLQHYI